MVEEGFGAHAERGQQPVGGGQPIRIEGHFDAIARLVRLFPRPIDASVVKDHMTAQVICDHSTLSSRLTDDEGRRCMACLLLHGDELAGAGMATPAGELELAG